MFAFSISSFSIWDWLDIAGPTLVLFGCGRELWLLIQRLPTGAPNLPELETKKHTQEVIAVFLVAFGVAIELIAVPHSLKEVAELQQSNLELQAKMQPRRIKIEQRGGFLNVLATTSNKSHIWILCNNPSRETLDLIFDIRRLLDDAGCAVTDRTPDFDKNKYPFGTSTQLGVFNSVDLNWKNEQNLFAFVVFSSSDAPDNFPKFGLDLFNAFTNAGI
jgi:hypothetical protein